MWMIHALVFVVVLVAAFASFGVIQRRRDGVRAGPASPPGQTAPDAPPPELAEVTAKVEPFLRTAWLPLVRDGDSPPGASKLSGVPWLAPGEAWPACGNCGRPMQLFVQLAANEVPAPARERIGAGNALQLFYCTSIEPECDVDAEGWAPHGRSTRVRIVAMDGAPQDVEMPAGMFPPRVITGWEAAEDYPHFGELEEGGVVLGDAEIDVLVAAYPTPGEKLLGWPLWVQGVEYPECRTCGARMEMLFQMDSEHTLPWMFGDVGIGHVTQCPNHPAEVAFGWACH